MTPQYSMVIEWSDDDNCFVVSLPDFGSFAKTHGDSYQEAVKNGEEVLELLIETYQEEGRELPKPSSVAFAQN